MANLFKRISGKINGVFMVDLSVEIGSVKLTHPVFNAAGVKDETYDQLLTIQQSGAAAVMMKSCTIKPREGNPEPRLYDFDNAIIQSMGLPNLGYKKYVEFAANLKQQSKKPVVASLSGFSTEEYVEMVKAFERSEVDLIEVNLSCPNVETKRMIAYDVDRMAELLDALSSLTNKPIGLKLPPYYEEWQFDRVSDIVLDHKIDFITCINTVGNCLFVDVENERPTIKPMKGFGGLSGKPIFPIALSNVKRFYDRLNHKVKIIGVGGISSGKDVFAYVLCGADAVQVGTTFYKEGPECFSRIVDELTNLMERKGYTSLADFRGKLKEW